jgi:hypothetical protein
MRSALIVMAGLIALPFVAVIALVVFVVLALTMLAELAVERIRS